MRLALLHIIACDNQIHVSVDSGHRIMHHGLLSNAPDDMLI